MVIQSHEGFISLLPAISKELKDGQFTGLCARGGYTVDAKWRDGRIVELTVNSDICDKADIELPDAQESADFVTPDGTVIHAESHFMHIPCGTDLKLI